MSHHDQLLTVAVAAALVGVVGWLGSGTVPLTPAHRPKPASVADR